jgi:hypothetical protein
MNDERRRAVAAWAVLAVPFAAVAGFLHAGNDLTAAAVGLYWFPAIVLAVIGAIPPPWRPLRG